MNCWECFELLIIVFDFFEGELAHQMNTFDLVFVEDDLNCALQKTNTLEKIQNIHLLEDLLWQGNDDIVLLFPSTE